MKRLQLLLQKFNVQLERCIHLQPPEPGSCEVGGLEMRTLDPGAEEYGFYRAELENVQYRTPLCAALALPRI